MARLVVLGWGNESRGDDGLGPLLLRRIEAAWPEIETIEDYQLQIEHALDIDGADIALFIDAGRGTRAPYSFAEVFPSGATTPTTHALAPEAVLEVLRRIKGATPPAFVLCVRGESFELGEGLSTDGAARLELAWAFCGDLMRQPSATGWRRRTL